MDILQSFGVGFSALVDALPCDIWLRDTEHTLIFANETAREHWGAKVGTRPEDQRVSKKVLAQRTTNNERALAGELVVDEVEYSGERFFKVVVPILHGGLILGTAGINVPLRELRVFEARINPNKILLGLVMDALPLGLGIRRVEDGDIVHCLDNVYSCELFGHTHEEMVGRTATELGIARQTIDRVLELYAEAKRRGGMVSSDIEFVDDRGTKLLEGALVPISAPAGTRPGEYFVLIGREVTDMLDPQHRHVDVGQLQSIEALVSAVSHEISNPLTYVMSNVALAEDCLEKGSLGAIEEARESLRAALGGLELVSSLVQDLRALAGGRKNDMGTADVVGVTRLVLVLVGRELERKTELALDLEPVPPVRGSPVKLAQVVLNLVKNALAAFPSDRPASENRLEIEARLVDDTVELEIRDNGPGVAPEIEALLFDRGTTTKSEEGGSGLGLHVSRDLIHAFGGTIEHRRPSSGGAAFVVRLPAA